MFVACMFLIFYKLDKKKKNLVFFLKQQYYKIFITKKYLPFMKKTSNNRVFSYSQFY